MALQQVVLRVGGKFGGFGGARADWRLPSALGDWRFLLRSQAVFFGLLFLVLS